MGKNSRSVRKIIIASKKIDSSRLIFTNKKLSDTILCHTCAFAFKVKLPVSSLFFRSVFFTCVVETHLQFLGQKLIAAVDLFLVKMARWVKSRDHVT